MKHCIEDNQAIIIVIDTPHMMEEDGKFNEYHNRCRRIGDLLKMTMDEKGNWLAEVSCNKVSKRTEPYITKKTNRG